MNNIFANGIVVNNGHPSNPSVRFISNKTTGLFLYDETAVGLASS